MQLMFLVSLSMVIERATCTVNVLVMKVTGMVTDGTFMLCDLSFTLVWEFIAGVPMHIPILSLTDYVVSSWSFCHSDNLNMGE